MFKNKYNVIFKDFFNIPSLTFKKDQPWKLLTVPIFVRWQTENQQRMKNLFSLFKCHYSVKILDVIFIKYFRKISFLFKWESMRFRFYLYRGPRDKPWNRKKTWLQTVWKEDLPGTYGERESKESEQLAHLEGDDYLYANYLY